MARWSAGSPTWPWPEKAVSISGPDRVRLLSGYVFIGPPVRASSPLPVALKQLPFASFAMNSLRRDFHPQECARARRTKQTPPTRRQGFLLSSEFLSSARKELSLERLFPLEVNVVGRSVYRVEKACGRYGAYIVLARVKV